MNMMLIFLESWLMLKSPQAAGGKPQGMFVACSVRAAPMAQALGEPVPTRV